VPRLFAASGFNGGTRLLLGEVDIADGDRVLDLCCGYGAIGAYAGRIVDCELWLSDACASSSDAVLISGCSSSDLSTSVLLRYNQNSFGKISC
jgi:16S rRNA (guanine1207-N2)-methyltransferase